MPLKGADVYESIEWDDAYAIGVPEIDAQHRCFLDLIQRIADLGDVPFGDTNAENLLREMDRYAYFHFTSEEALMDIYDYEGLDEQKRIHFHLLQVLDKRISDFRSQDARLPQLADFLARWFISHLKEDDKSLGEHIQSERGADS
jgi:hemerythrin